MSTSHSHNDQAREQARDKSTGRFGSYRAAESGATLGGIVEASETTEGYMGQPGWIGGKHQKGRDITEIAKDVRSDLKRAQDDQWLRDDLTYSVRTERFSGGRALRVNIKGMSDDERLAYTPDVYSRGFNPRGGLSEQAHQTKARVEDIVDQYNRDESNSQVDFFDVDFYDSVGFESDQDALADQTERDRKRITKKMQEAGLSPGEQPDNELADEIAQMKTRHNQAQHDITARKARRLASWRSQWAESEAGEGSVEHTSARLREEVLTADLPEGWLSRARPTTGSYTDGEYESATVYASLDRPDDDTLNDLRPNAVQLQQPGTVGVGSRGIEAVPVNDNGGEVTLRPYRVGEDHQHTYDTASETVVHVDDAGDHLNRMTSNLEATTR